MAFLCFFFLTFILLILLLDLGLINKKAHEITFKEAGIWTIIWITLALTFNIFFYYYSLSKFSHDTRLLSINGFSPALAAEESALEFLTGYLIEKSLAIDNIFVFVVIFSFFRSHLNISIKFFFLGL